MMHRKWNPATIAPPASGYSHAVLTEAPQRWLTLSGQLGLLPDGQLPDNLAAQLDAAFANVDAGLAEAGMTRDDLVKVTVYLTENTPDSVSTYRARRDAWIGSAAPPAATLLIVAGLAAPRFLCEVDAIAAA
ncbi:MAG: RidA family protein [Paracoccaceae bacterium]|nr:MAG: RidA family protein [Paracoccaceae bacterium]